MAINKEILTSNVIGCVDYYQNLVDQTSLKGNPDFLWNLGLFLSQQLLEMIKSDSPNIEELRILVKVLEQDFLVFGSGWCDLYWQAKHFLDFVENKE